MRRTNERTDKRTDAGNQFGRILALKSDIWWQYFDDFPDNQLTKFLIYWLIPDFYPLLNFYEVSRFVPSIGWTPLTDTTDKETVSLSVCPFVRLSLRWSLTQSFSYVETARQVEREKIESEELVSKTSVEKYSLDRTFLRLENDNSELRQQVQKLQSQLSQLDSEHAQRWTRSS